MYANTTLDSSGLATGRSDLDGLLQVSGGLVTLRCPSAGWLFKVAAGLLARGVREDAKALYLQWADYHERYWSLDYDLLMQEAARAGVPPALVEEQAWCFRVFSRDAAEEEGNWEKLRALEGKVGLMVLDSVDGLFAAKAQREQAKPVSYSIGRFAQLCIEKDCHGVVLDYSRRPIHPFLGELSSVILEFSFEGSLWASLKKHPCMPELVMELPLRRQRTLARWLA